MRLFCILKFEIISPDAMEIHIYLKGKSDPAIFNAERIDILDINLEGIDYKQIRYFKKGVSKSQYISADLIKKIKEVKNTGDKH